METNKRVHLIGIGGIGISGLARLYLHDGWRVSGSDQVDSENTKKLEAEGIEVIYTQNADNISSRQDLELVVYSDGVQPGTKGWGELEAARASGIETISYFEALGRVANEYYLIAVAGTHGKTTTTAMLIDILEEASLDPTAIVGSLRTKTGSNFRAGKSKYMVIEADEYMRHFLYFKPDVLIINNLDHDHPDYFKDLADVQSAFAELVAKVPEDGVIVTQPGDANIAPVLTKAKATIIDYKEQLDLSLQLKQPGLHNRMNAAAASTVTTHLGIEPATITTALENFAGTARRFEYKGDVNGAPVYDDYAHNPQKVVAAIAGARELHPDKCLTIVFQPHTYSRTKELFDEFVAALGSADNIILVPIYASREQDDGSISSEMLVETLVGQGKSAQHFFTLEAAAQKVKDTAISTDVVLVAGAGDVTKVSNLLTV